MKIAFAKTGALALLLLATQAGCGGSSSPVQPTGAFEAIAVAGTHVWAVGTGAFAAKSPTGPLIGLQNGKPWKFTRLPGAARGTVLSGVSAANASEVWTVGTLNRSPVAYRWNGSAWKNTPIGQRGDATSLAAVTSTGVTAMTVGSYQGSRKIQHPLMANWTGSRWRESTLPDHASLTAVTALSPVSAWAVGHDFRPVSGRENTYVARWNGSTWHHVTSPNFVYVEPSGAKDPADQSLLGVAAISSSDVWAVGIILDYGSPVNTLFEQWNGHRWSFKVDPLTTTCSWSDTMSGSTSACDRILAVAADSKGRLWSVGQRVHLSPNPGCISSCSDIETDSPTAELFDGTTWKSLPLASNCPKSGRFSSVTVSKDGTAWAVGTSLHHVVTAKWNGTSWTCG